MSAKAPETCTPARSGFCNPSFVYGIGNDSHDASHARCHKADCPCTCHAEPEPEPEPVITADAYDALNDRTVFAPGVYPRYVGPSNITVARGSYSWWATDTVLTLLRDPDLPPEAWSVGPFSVVTSRLVPANEVRLVHPDGTLAAKVLVTP